MKKTVIKGPSVAMCRECRGTGTIEEDGKKKRCPQCNGSGRVIVSCVMEVEVTPYQGKRH